MPSFFPSPGQRQYGPVLIAPAEKKAGATFHVIGGMFPADGVQLPRLRRALGSLKKLELTLQFHSLFLLAEAGGHGVKRIKAPVWVKNNSVGGEGSWRVRRERRAVASSASRQASAWEVAQDEGWDCCSWQPPAHAAWDLLEWKPWHLRS